MQLRLTFSDGAVKDVDLAPYLDGKIFAPLKDRDYFRTVQVNPDLDTIVWDNGADFAPEFLYEIGQLTPIEEAVST
jgi:hypothetical protein